jgi:hypothetical protein
MAGGVWVTAGAPLEDGDGWRVWYSWPAGDFTPAVPRVRTAAGVDVDVLPGEWAPAAAPKGSARRMGVREIRLANPQPGALYEVTVPEHGRPLMWRTLPGAIPENGSVSLLIGSCFWINDDRDGHYSGAVRELVQQERPMFKVLMGDQLYVDVWSPGTKDIRKGLAEKYERYWGDDAYRELLASCPTFVSCDDHEFWNDFPEKQIHVPLSWDGNFAEASAGLAELYDAYQSSLNPGGKRWCAFKIKPVSFFIADTRSNRSRQGDEDAALMLEEQWVALERWGRELEGPGVLVLPQPLLKEGGSPTDRTLVDFKESDRLGQVFQNVFSGQTADQKSHDILILTGDIHTGRVSSAEIMGMKGEVFELVASPASMVTPWLPPWGHKPSKLPDKLVINRRTWKITAHRRLTATVDNNIGLIRIERGRNDRYRFTVQLWRVRPFVGLGRRIFGGRPAKGAQAIHEPIELELR